MLSYGQILVSLTSFPLLCLCSNFSRLELIEGTGKLLSDIIRVDAPEDSPLWQNFALGAPYSSLLSLNVRVELSYTCTDGAWDHIIWLIQNSLDDVELCTDGGLGNACVNLIDRGAVTEGDITSRTRIVHIKDPVETGGISRVSVWLQNPIRNWTVGNLTIHTRFLGPPEGRLSSTGAQRRRPTSAS